MQSTRRMRMDDMNPITRRRLFAWSLAATATPLLASCSGTSAEGHLSREKIYPDVSAMAKDSDLIVIGTVVANRVAADVDGVTDFTLATVRVDEVIGSRKTAPGLSVVVRQTGSARQAAVVPLLVEGKSYLLYLTLSGLPGELSTQFYVTGANAGVYIGDGGDVYQQVQKQEGESLPKTIKKSNAKG